MTIPTIIIKVLREYFRLAAIGLSLLILIFGYFIFLNKKIQTIQTTSFSTRSRAESELKTAETTASQLRRSIDTFRQTFKAEDIQRIKDLLPHETEFPEILLTINTMVTVAGLDMQSILVNEVTFDSPSQADATTESASAPTKTGPASIEALRAKDIIITLERGTGYEQFKQFLTIVESSEQLFDIVSLTYETPLPNQTSTFTFSLRTYYLSDSPAPAP